MRLTPDWEARTATVMRDIKAVLQLGRGARDGRGYLLGAHDGGRDSRRRPRVPRHEGGPQSLLVGALDSQRRRAQMLQ